MMAPEGCTDQSKETSIGAALIRLSHATSTEADDRQAAADTCLEPFCPLLPTQLNGMLADLKAVPKNLIINPHLVHMAARELTGVTLAKKRRGQALDDYEKDKHAGWLSGGNPGSAASGFDKDTHAEEIDDADPFRGALPSFTKNSDPYCECVNMLSVMRHALSCSVRGGGVEARSHTLPRPAPQRLPGHDLLAARS